MADREEIWIEVTDPAEALYGKRLLLDRMTRRVSETAYVFLRRSDGVILRVPRRATSLAVLVECTPRTKLNAQSVAEFLSLVKEYELCPSPKTSRPKKSGPRSTSKRVRKS